MAVSGPAGEAGPPSPWGLDGPEDAEDASTPACVKYGDVVTLALETDQIKSNQMLDVAAGGGSAAGGDGTYNGLVTADGVADARVKCGTGDPRAAGTHADGLFVVLPAQTYAARRELDKFEAGLAGAAAAASREPAAVAAEDAPMLHTAALKGQMRHLRAAAKQEAAANEATVERLRGAPVLYGAAVQLQHMKSGKVKRARA
jgi:hypothetical protein